MLGIPIPPPLNIDIKPKLFEVKGNIVLYCTLLASLADTLNIYYKYIHPDKRPKHGHRLGANKRLSTTPLCCNPLIAFAQMTAQVGSKLRTQAPRSEAQCWPHHTCCRYCRCFCYCCRACIQCWLQDKLLLRQCLCCLLAWNRGYWTWPLAAWIWSLMPLLTFP